MALERDESSTNFLAERLGLVVVREGCQRQRQLSREHRIAGIAGIAGMVGWVGYVECRVGMLAGHYR